VQFWSYSNRIHHNFDCATALIDLCHKNILAYVVHTKVAKAAHEFLKARTISALVFWIRKSYNKAGYIVVIDANEIDIVGILL